VLSSTGAARAEGFDASVSSEVGPIEGYLIDRVAEIEYGIESAEKVAAGAKQTAATLRDELKQAKADLKAHRAGTEQ
jgi:F0F1-type ATP synthase membrane subunit b/b'